MSALVTVQDLKSLGFCNRKSRLFFEKHGLDWASFVQSGISSDELDHIEDTLVDTSVAAAEQRLAKSQREK